MSRQRLPNRRGAEAVAFVRRDRSPAKPLVEAQQRERSALVARQRAAMDSLLYDHKVENDSYWNKPVKPADMESRHEKARVKLRTEHQAELKKLDDAHDKAMRALIAKHSR